MKNPMINMRILFVALAMSFLVSACSKSGCKNVAPSEEDASLVAYNSSHSITAIKHSNGMYYEIINPGSDAKPRLGSTLFVKYVGKKLDDTIFDQNDIPGATGFSLASLIKAWQEALPMIGKGGRIKITVPSALAYGCQGSGTSIPANTPLYFDITLYDFY